MNVTNKIISTLKNQIRKCGLTYHQVATRINLTESGLKKTFAKNNLTLDRIEQICIVIELPFCELIRLSEIQNIDQTPTFTEHQDSELASNEQDFVIFYLLLSGYISNQIFENFNFSEEEISNSIKKLCDLKLMKKDQNSIIRPSKNYAPIWITDGKLEKKYLTDLVSEFIDNKTEGPSYKRFIVTHIDPSQIPEMIEELNRVEKKFILKSRSTKKEDKQTFALFHSIRPWKFSFIEKYRKN